MKLLELKLSTVKKMLRIPDWDKFEDQFQDASSEVGAIAEQEHRDATGTEEDINDDDATEAGFEAQSRYMNNAYRAYMNAVDDSISNYSIQTENSKSPIELSVNFEKEKVYVHGDSEKDLTIALIDIVNGIGLFYYGSVEEALQTGYRTYTDFNQAHIEYLKDYSEVYGQRPPNFHRNFESYARNI